MSVELPPLPASQYAFADPEGFGPDIPAFSADQMRAYAAEALKARKPLTELECIKTLPRDVLHGDPVRLTFDSGPYEITRPSNVLLTVIRAIERAHGIGEQA